MPDLDFEPARRDLRERILVPELATITGRAAAIRRRRRGLAVASSALACLAVLATAVLVVDDGVRPPEPVTASPDLGPAWRGAGLTVVGLSDTVVDQPGDVTDVQFADASHGFALTSACAADCRIAVAATHDGGHTWSDWSLLPQSHVDKAPRLFAVGADSVVLDGPTPYFGFHGAWRAATTATEPIEAVPDGARLRVGGPDGDCSSGPVQAWTMDGMLVRLAHQPSLETVCQALQSPAADGAWWVAGAVGGAPAVAVSRDNGRVWTVTTLPGTGSWAQVSTVGSDVFAAVVAPRGGQPYPDSLTIHAIYRSRAGGAFTLQASEPGTLIGDVVPLLDGRLVVAGPDWYVGTGSLSRAGGSLPWVRRLSRTPGGWVAYDLFNTGWAAFSLDGALWRKINVR